MIKVNFVVTESKNAYTVALTLALKRKVISELI